MVHFIPHDVKFLELFEEMCSNLIDASRKLVQVLQSDTKELESGVRNIKGLERRGDEMARELFIKLNQTFITPFDREDIHQLASSIDDVLDFVNAAAARLQMYKIENPSTTAVELAQIIVRQSEELAQACSLLEDGEEALPHCVEINRLENQADQISRAGIAHIFETETDPIALIKLKELYEVLETATNKAEDAAGVIEAIVLKGA